MPGKPGYDSLATMPSCAASAQERHKALQYTLRVATRDTWPRSGIEEVLEALGLVEPPSPVSSLSPAPEKPAAAKPGAKSGASTSRVRDWCQRRLHRMAGENVYVAPSGYRMCRKCRQATRAGIEPVEMHPAEPGSPEYKPVPTPVTGPMHESAPTTRVDGPVGGLWCARRLHPLVGDNVIYKHGTSGRRECRECRNERRRWARARKRGARIEEESA